MNIHRRQLALPAIALGLLASFRPSRPTRMKKQFLSLAYEDVMVRVVGTAAVVRFH